MAFEISLEHWNETPVKVAHSMNTNEHKPLDIQTTFLRLVRFSGDVVSLWSFVAFAIFLSHFPSYHSHEWKSRKSESAELIKNSVHKKAFNFLNYSEYERNCRPMKLLKSKFCVICIHLTFKSFGGFEELAQDQTLRLNASQMKTQNCFFFDIEIF